jgi:hypothetical protein
MFWVAVVVACKTPAAISCDTLVRTEVFYEREACMNEMKQVVDMLVMQRLGAKGRCVQIKAGEAA